MSFKTLDQHAAEAEGHELAERAVGHGAGRHDQQELPLCARVYSTEDAR